MGDKGFHKRHSCWNLMETGFFRHQSHKRIYNYKQDILGNATSPVGENR